MKRSFRRFAALFFPVRTLTGHSLTHHNKACVLDKLEISSPVEIRANMEHKGCTQEVLRGDKTEQKIYTKGGYGSWTVHKGYRMGAEKCNKIKNKEVFVAKMEQ